MSNTITIELCAEDRARLDRILAALEGAPSEMRRFQSTEEMAEFAKRAYEERAEAAQEAPAAPEAEAPKDDKPEPEAPAQPDPAPAEEPVKKYTRAEVQALVQKLAAPAAGKREAVKAIVNEYAPRVGLIPEEKFGEVMERLTALEKEGKA